MSRNQKDESPQRRAEPDQPLREENETLERDPEKVSGQPTDADPRPAERPDLDWAEHED
ncbi:MAG TPA: hypothetical protein VI750_05605 [Pyrinomonadaceae bacterium]|nr:hypothetical protein [Pyrinomonadaceae bacterium]